MARLVSFSANNIGALFGLAAFAVFSFSDVVVKQLGATYSPFQIVFFSALLSFPLITLVLMSDQKPGTLRPVHPWWIALRSVSGATSAVCAFYAFSQLALSQVYAIIFASPLIITILAIPMLGETVRLRRGLAILFGLGFSGVMTCIWVCVREMTPPKSGGLSLGIVSLFGWIGMGLGGYLGGLFFDLTGDYTFSYASAALAGVVNLMILGSLLLYVTRKQAAFA